MKHILSLLQQLLMPSLLLLCAKDTSSSVGILTLTHRSICDATLEGVDLEIVVVQSHEIPRIRFMKLNATLVERAQKSHKIQSPMID